MTESRTGILWWFQLSVSFQASSPVTDFWVWMLKLWSSLLPWCLEKKQWVPTLVLMLNIYLTFPKLVIKREPLLQWTNYTGS